MIEIEDFTEEIARREQAKAVIGIAYLEFEHAKGLARMLAGANVVDRLYLVREVGRCVSRLDELLREADDHDASFTRLSPTAAMLRREVRAVRGLTRGR